MARKDSGNRAHPRGMSDIIGIVLIALALLLLVAQLSFDRYDLEANRVPVNQAVHNWIGSAGALGANLLFQFFGAAAFVLPLLLLLFGIGYLFEFFAYLKRRWFWAAVLLFCSLGFFDLYSHLLEGLRYNLNAPSAGGYIGKAMNDWVFGRFGKPGATIIYGTLYLISVIYLTNFHLGDWLRSLFHRETKLPGEEHWTPEEKVLARRARDLQRKALKLQEEMERSGLGADLQPVPVPTVRDLSVPQPRSDRKSRAKTPEPDSETDGVEGEIIPAGEVRAASTKDILGDHAKTKPDAHETSPETEPEAEPAAAESKPTPAVPIKITDQSMGRRRPKKPKPITVAAHADDRQLPVAADGFLSIPGPERQTDRVQGGIDGQRAADAADAGAVRHRSCPGRHHQRPDDHPLRIASRRRA